ncbi:hypothetical protein E3P92_02391 [Wallemia ichthyophaga]|uniref:Uncharacterized protein n=2 Tax=Wallemia ichthyophaga TaxID=245174 RepID=A0A4T0ECT7_WALIC|nr:uncharacterized protein J056_003486 [Wallemia ichthyophaga EXF-994]TIA71795.1 hypothetical protein E3P91_02403 [Wallemia ichthyophaga]EOR02924.1 hypothetical protein J056_003486 [Wallemia ichthyophaga EXF-994]TIA81240.1 hypothetical protein E3P98_02208 [Wallemia ichthyophaga]TIA90881.1 hypothetical protein E3P97_02332 [Wallemia ichthyophaga]TIA99766.1 hypothetical protein E3P95_01956 [Wallemia ichthyophaga]
MRATRIILEHVHTPRIKFLGRRVWSKGEEIIDDKPEPPHPHPDAPKDFKDNFASFVQARENYTQPTPSAPNTYTNFWDLPQRFHKIKFAPYSEYEMEAIESGGASVY